MREVPFKLCQDEDGWPPVGVEWLWLTERGGNFENLQPPLFIPGLAAGDEISINLLDNEGSVTDWTLVRPSGNSVMWISDIGGGGFEEILSQLKKTGCNVTVLSGFLHAAVDIPPSVSSSQIDNIIDGLDSDHYAIAFPCDRQTS